MSSYDQKGKVCCPAATTFKGGDVLSGAGVEVFATSLMDGNNQRCLLPTAGFDTRRVKLTAVEDRSQPRALLLRTSTTCYYNVHTALQARSA